LQTQLSLQPFPFCWFGLPVDVHAQGGQQGSEVHDRKAFRKFVCLEHSSLPALDGSISESSGVSSAACKVLAAAKPPSLADEGVDLAGDSCAVGTLCLTIAQTAL
jgi:hypothetical protein